MALRPSQIRATNGDAALMNSSAARLSGRYEGLAMPVAIMAGRGDKIVDIGPQPQWLHALVPQSTLQVINGTGHMLHHEYPERVGETVEALCAAMWLDASLEQTIRQAAP
jgi:pimeloyl-ACP methyl ester carboxylesterase